jgi:hypothetical protein
VHYSRIEILGILALSYFWTQNFLVSGLHMMSLGRDTRPSVVISSPPDYPFPSSMYRDAHWFARSRIQAPLDFSILLENSFSMTL